MTNFLFFIDFALYRKPLCNYCFAPTIFFDSLSQSAYREKRTTISTLLCLKGFSLWLVLCTDLQSVTLVKIIGRFATAEWRFAKLKRHFDKSETPNENRGLQIAFFERKLRKSCTFAA